jgi:hypothetical protein
MSDKVKINEEYQFSYPALSKDDLYVLAKNEFFPENKTFVFIGKMKFKHKIKKLKPMSTSDDGHLFCFIPRILGIYNLEVYEGKNLLDTLKVEVI